MPFEDRASAEAPQRVEGDAMYGLVNQAIEELVIETAGHATWERIKNEAGFPDPSFVGMQPYPDDVTYGLVAAASRILDVAADELLRAFGRHWILFTGREGYGALLDMAGSSLPEFLQNLDALHARLGMSMPDLQPPSFVIDEVAPETGDGEILIVRYYSDRAGLTAMVEGLLEGLGERFQVDLKIEHTVESDHDAFRLVLGHATAG